MRPLRRRPLDQHLQDWLADQQAEVDQAGPQQGAALWSEKRSSPRMAEIVAVLRQMVGPAHRCVYCVDSEAADIEHFRPKSRYPEHSFVWPNLLLACPICNRFKGARFPLDADDQPLLIDPTLDDPWQFLDFDPDTGILIARYDPVTGDEIAKGAETVALLHLDREALMTVYQKNFARLKRLLNRFLNSKNDLTLDQLISTLQDEDDHGLLHWCFPRSGEAVEPFSRFQAERPSDWAYCVEKIHDRTE